MSADRVFAQSINRYAASAAEKREHGGSTITVFLVGFAGSDASTWQRVKGFGRNPGVRKAYAIKSFLGSQTK